MSMFIIALAILIPFGLAVLFPKQVEGVFTGMKIFRKYVIGAVSVVFALLFLWTGDLFLGILGGLIIAYVVWKAVFDTDMEVKASA